MNGVLRTTASDSQENTYTVRHTGDRILFQEDNVALDFPGAELPRSFVDWQVEDRRVVFRELEQGRMPTFMHAHLPVVATRGAIGSGINLSNKGIGLLPPEPDLEFSLESIRATIARTASLPREQSLRLRLAAAAEIYKDPNALDTRRMVGLEIFMGTTFANLRRDRQASLLFTGAGPHYPSYQIDCVVEIVTPGSKAYEFALAMRELFARDPFHVHQTAYPFGYVFWVSKVAEKTPRPHGGRPR